MTEEATDVAKALAAFGAPSIRYQSFSQSQVRPSNVVLPRRVFSGAPAHAELLRQAEPEMAAERVEPYREPAMADASRLSARPLHEPPAPMPPLFAPAPSVAPPARPLAEWAAPVVPVPLAPVSPQARPLVAMQATNSSPLHSPLPPPPLPPPMLPRPEPYRRPEPLNGVASDVAPIPPPPMHAPPPPRPPALVASVPPVQPLGAGVAKSAPGSVAARASRSLPELFEFLAAGPEYRTRSGS